MKNETRILTGCSLKKGEIYVEVVSVNILFSNNYKLIKLALPLAKFIVLLE